ncbi:MAG: SDR family NAD(P)-dependent oxidoreductase, partial [Promethearchaeota archaeon]
MINQKYKFKGKFCVITGANAGIGKETAMQLAAKGYHIIMICRNKEKAEIAQNEIKDKSGNEKIDLLIADLASLKSVENVAKEFKQKYEYLHVLINNAGIFNRKRMVTENGYESTFAVDYLAHFLLTN